MAVSIIIPTRNEAAALPQLLAGLLPELRRQWELEVIVSDAGSTDGTLRVARSLGARVVEAVLGEKQNIAIGRNAGAQEARGEVLIFMDADCYPLSWTELLARTSEAMRDEHTVAATVRVEIDPRERQLKDRLWLGFFNRLFVLENALGFGMGRGNCQIVRASAFHQVGGYEARLAAAEDYDLYRRLRRLGRIRFLWDVVVYESPRRFRRYGYPKVAWLWFINSLSVIVRRRAWSREWRRVGD